MIPRPDALNQIAALFGPRQCCKTTRARMFRVSGNHYGFEFKYADAPGRHRSMHTAIQDLKLEHLWVVYPGHQEYPLDEKISVVPLSNTLEYLPRLGSDQDQQGRDILEILS